ncbi:MAG: hypothetical protein MUF06_08740 [Pirellulaceae bacterium]|jgi:hypothetical protein|nr:hypothetical protein [Pirellulaceae bacterium]
MTLTLIKSAVAALVLVAAGIAHGQEVVVEDSGYAVDGAACPDGNCPGGIGHGRHQGPHFAGTHQYGHHHGDARGYNQGASYLGYNKDFHEYGGPGGCRTCSNGQCQYRFYGQPDLFYNYYAWPSCGGVGAELYLSPRPVPPHVGHTYITYQPLYPHEFLYTHHRTYHRYYNGGQGLNRTSVHYRASLFGH